MRLTLSNRSWVDIFNCVCVYIQRKFCVIFLQFFSNGISIPFGGIKAKDMMQNIFGQKMFNQEEHIDDEGPLGNHGIQKNDTTHAQRFGCFKDERDVCGRWKCK